MFSMHVCKVNLWDVEKPMMYRPLLHAQSMFNRRVQKIFLIDFHVITFKAFKSLSNE